MSKIYFLFLLITLVTCSPATQTNQPLGDTSNNQSGSEDNTEKAGDPKEKPSSNPTQPENPLDNTPKDTNTDTNSHSTPSPATKHFRSDFTEFKQTLAIKKSVTIDDLFYAYYLSPLGNVISGIKNDEAADNYVAQLIFPGSTQQKSGDRVGPGAYGTHLESDFGGELYHYGIYRIRFQGPTCSQNNEGVIGGLFTYLNDGKDHNQNGITDNSELDIEIACNEPYALYLSIWTDYTDDNTFVKNTRKIYLDTGKFDQTKTGNESKYGLGLKGTLPFQFPGIDLRKKFHTIELIWKPNSVEFNWLVDDQVYQLWKFTNTQMIPQLKSYFMMNIWHSGSLWSNDQIAEYPDSDAILSIDFFDYTPDLQSH